MKNLLVLSILFCAIAMPALAELTDADLDKIRLIVKEEIQKEVTSSEARMKEYVDLKFNNVDLKFNNVDSQFESSSKQLSIYQWGLGILSLFVIASIGIPAWRGRRDRDQDRKIDELRQEIETLKQQKIVSP